MNDRNISQLQAPSLIEQVAFFKALANPIRAQIVEFLLHGERCVCEMTGPLDISQPLVSHHLALLRDAGLIRQRNEANRTYYSIDWEKFDTALADIVTHVERARVLPSSSIAGARTTAAGNACAVPHHPPKRKETP